MSDYHDLLVYQKSKTLVSEFFMYFDSKKISWSKQFLVNQVTRSACSIGANIAKGYGRYYRKSFRQFLGIARGSCFETNYWLEIMVESKIFEKDKIESWQKQVSVVSKMLTALMKKLE